MSFIPIAYYTFLKNVRDWKFILLLVVAPLLTIWITGTATVNIDERSNLEKTRLAYYSSDSGQLAKEFVNFLTGAETQTGFAVQASPSFDEGMQQVKDGKIEAFIYVGNGFTDSFITGEKPKLQVFANKDLSPAQLLVEGFMDRVNATTAAQAIGGSPVKAVSPGVSQVALSATGKAPTGLDDWTYLNMLLIIFYGAMFGSFSVINNRTKHTQLRFDIAPIHKFACTFGLFLGNMLTLFGCVILTIVVTLYAYGSNWQGNPLVILLTFLLFSAITTAFGMSLGYLTKKSSLSILIIVCLNIFSGNTAVSASIGLGNDFFKWFSLISPHYYGYLALTDTIFHGPDYRIQAALTSLTVGAVALTGLTLLLGRRQPA